MGNRFVLAAELIRERSYVLRKEAQYLPVKEQLPYLAKLKRATCMHHAAYMLHAGEGMALVKKMTGITHAEAEWLARFG